MNLWELRLWLAPDEGGGAPGAEVGAATGQAETPGTAAETITKEEHQKELDRYRNLVGQGTKEANELKRQLAELQAANQTEAEKLAAKAKRADELEPENETLRTELDALRTVLLAEVEARVKDLPKAIAKLLPTTLSPADQLAWIREATAAAAELKPNGGLPASGQRSPANTKPSNEPSEEDRARAAARYRSSF